MSLSTASCRETQTANERRAWAITRRAVASGTWGKYGGPSRQEIDARAANVPNPDAWILGDSDGAGFEPAAKATAAPAAPAVDLAAVAETVKTRSTTDLFWRLRDAEDAPELLDVYRAELARRAFPTAGDLVRTAQDQRIAGGFVKLTWAAFAAKFGGRAATVKGGVWMVDGFVALNHAVADGAAVVPAVAPDPFAGFEGDSECEHSDELDFGRRGAA